MSIETLHQLELLLHVELVKLLLTVKQLIFLNYQQLGLNFGKKWTINFLHMKEHC